jgi:hypothetical protein
MKKCPTCGKEFEDSMKFCQVDGTPLVDDAPAFDPYATIVSTPGNPMIPPADEAAPADESIAGPTVGSMPIAPPDDILDLPAAADPMKTMMVSESEMRDVFADPAPADEPPDTAAEIPDMPTPSEVITPEVSEPEAPSFGDVGAPPPSPFGSEPPPTPFGSAPAEPEQTPAFEEPATVIQPMADIPFEPPTPVQEWTPPPAPDAQWQNQQIGSNTPFQPPVVGADGANKTLPIVSLVLGILSICCYVAPVTGAIALITGWLGMKNIKNDPNTYGGKGLAMAGMIVGGIFFLLGIVYWIYIIFVVGFAAMSGAFSR